MTRDAVYERLTELFRDLFDDGKTVRNLEFLMLIPQFDLHKCPVCPLRKNIDLKTAFLIRKDIAHLPDRSDARHEFFLKFHVLFLRDLAFPLDPNNVGDLLLFRIPVCDFAFCLAFPDPPGLPLAGSKIILCDMDLPAAEPVQFFRIRIADQELPFDLQWSSLPVINLFCDGNTGIAVWDQHRLKCVIQIRLARPDRVFFAVMPVQLVKPGTAGRIQHRGIQILHKPGIIVGVSLFPGNPVKDCGCIDSFRQSPVHPVMNDRFAIPVGGIDNSLCPIGIPAVLNCTGIQPAGILDVLLLLRGFQIRG